MEIIFEKPLMLLWLFLIPILIILHYYFFEHNKKKAMRFSNFSAMKRVTGTHLITKNTTQLVLRLLVIMLFIVSSSQPIAWYETDVAQNDYVIAIDASASMVSQDVLPNRLDVAKQAANLFVKNIKENTNFAIVSFSGTTFIKSALTNDKSIITKSIDNIDIELSGGTDIGSALITATNLFKTDKSKTIILITDGSDTAGSFVEDSINTALSYITKNQIKVHSIAIGSGTTKIGYLEGVNLPAAFDTNTLKQISEATNGLFYEVKTINDILQAFSDIQNDSTKGKVSFDTSSLFFLLGLILLLFEWVLLNTKFRSLP
jgi:Ca-activated chloride channel homolog